MAQIREVRLVDDLDGSDAQHENVVLQVAGKRVKLDLNETHYQELLGVADKFLQAGQPAGHDVAPGRRPRGSVGARRNNRELAAIREWARQNGHQVSDRGRIARPVVEAYRAAH